MVAIWTDPAIKPTIREMVSDFEQQNPDIKVKLTDLTWSHGHEKIVLAFASGRGPDVVELGSDWIAQFAENGQLTDISADIASDSAEYQGWSMANYNGRIMAYPWFLGTRVLFGNLDLMAKAGYDDTFVPVSWPQLLEASKKISALGPKYYGWGSNAPEKHRLYKKYLPFLWSAGGQILTDDGKLCVIASTYAIDGLTIYKMLHDSAGYVAKQRGIEDAFLDGKVGFIISGDWLLKRIEKENRKINLLSTLIPGPTLPGRSFKGGEFLAINAKSEKKEAAMKFVRFITSPEQQIKFCKANRSANPSSVKAQQDPYFASNDHIQTFIKQIRLAKHPPVDPDWVYMEGIIEQAVEDVVFNGEPVAESLRKARHEIEKQRK